MNSHYAEKLILEVLEKKAFLYQGVRKIVQDVTWQPKNLPPYVDFSDLGYGSNKLKQLQRNYVNEEEFQRVRAVLTKRRDHAFTSVALSLRGASKDSRSMGHCMLSLVVSRSKGYTTAELQYRSTELILKFGGDLAFLPWIFEELEIKPDLVRFRFANCFLSGVYFPYVCNSWDPLEFLECVYYRDERLFQQGTRFFLRSAYKEDQVFPYSPENVAHRYAWKILGKRQMRDVREFLEEKHKTYGKPLPKLHYKEGEYIPRGKRLKEEEEE